MPHICKYCKKDVVGAENFKHHEFLHLSNTCQLCGKNFLVANKLKRHFENCRKVHGNSSSEFIQNNPSMCRTSEDFIFQDFKNSQKIHENSNVNVIQNIPSSSTTTEKFTDFVFQDFKNSQTILENFNVDFIQNIQSSSTATEKPTMPDILSSKISYCHF